VVSTRHVVIIRVEGGLICESGKKVFFSATNSIYLILECIYTNVLYFLIGITNIISSTKDCHHNQRKSWTDNYILQRLCSLLHLARLAFIARERSIQVAQVHISEVQSPPGYLISWAREGPSGSPEKSIFQTTFLCVDINL
jgi:hypothetical protein